jgi:hypothetical protein
MELFNKSGLLVASVLVMVGALIACQAQEDGIPSSTVIEAAATQGGPNGQGASERRLQEWAEQGSPVAQRELALHYLATPSRRDEAMRLFERAANAGDAQAALGLVAMSRDANPRSDTGGTGELKAGRLLKEAANSNFALH